MHTQAASLFILFDSGKVVLYLNGQFVLPMYYDGIAERLDTSCNDQNSFASLYHEPIYWSV